MSLGELLNNRYVWLDGLVWTVFAGASWAYLRQSKQICEMIDALFPGTLDAIGRTWPSGYLVGRSRGLTGLLFWNNISDSNPDLDSADFRRVLNGARLSAVVLMVSLVAALSLLAAIDISSRS